MLTTRACRWKARTPVIARRSTCSHLRPGTRALRRRARLRIATQTSVGSGLRYERAADTHTGFMALVARFSAGGAYKHFEGPSAFLSVLRYRRRRMRLIGPPASGSGPRDQ